MEEEGAAIEDLSDELVDLAKKVRGSKKGKQFVKNTKKATYKKKK
jgi:hypothetical protein